MDGMSFKQWSLTQFSFTNFAFANAFMLRSSKSKNALPSILDIEVFCTSLCLN